MDWYPILIKGVNTASEVVPIWLAVRYILDIGQYWCTVSGLLLLYIYMYVCMYVCVCVCVCYNKYKS